MKIVWITPSPVSGLYDNSVHESGSWIDAAYHGCKDIAEFEFHIISFSASVSDVQTYHDGRHIGYVIPYVNLEKFLSQINSSIHPDIVQLWGTEQKYMLQVVKVFDNVPKIAYIQGVARNIAKNFLGGISTTDRLLNLTPRDIYLRGWIDAKQSEMWKMAKTEKAVLSACQAAIVENNWCEDQIKAIAPHIRIFRSLLPIKEVFFNYDWSLNKVKRHSIFTNAGGYPIKGHHTLFEAMQYVVRKYPDTKLYIPGHSRLGSGFKNWLHRTTYETILTKMVKKYKLEGHICPCGILSSEQMAQQIASCHVFAMPSWVENHSSSLIEAMVVGAPCVTSCAGGVVSFVKNGENAFMYNPQDAECLAGNIIRIFENDELAVSLSQEAKKMREKRKVDFHSEYINIYHSLLDNQI